MRTLFARILLLFWCAFAIVIAANVLIEGTTRTRGFAPPNGAGDPFAFIADLAAGQLRESGRAGVVRMLVALERDPGMRVFAIDSAGTELRGRPLPPEVAGAAHAVLSGGERRAYDREGGLTVAYPVRAGDGRALALVIQPLRHRPRLGPPHDLWQSGLVLLVVSGVGCYLLARHITAPVLRLRRATQRLAEGDLAARVGTTGRRAQDELDQLGMDFDRMAQRVEAVVSSQRRLLSDISHELRSPLARMSVALGLLRQREIAGSEDMIARLETETGRLDRLIGDLLLLSRLESGANVADERRPEGRDDDGIALGELVAGIVEDASFEATERRCDVRLAATDDRLRVDGVPELLHSAIENVVRNAVRHTAEGTQVEVRVERRAGDGGACAAVSVRDHGPGVPAGDIERIFEPFHRVEAARERRSGGVGLGLAIARRAVLRHRGRITARPAEGGGLVVEILLPCRLAAPA